MDSHDLPSVAYNDGCCPSCWPGFFKEEDTKAPSASVGITQPSDPKDRIALVVPQEKPPMVLQPLAGIYVFPTHPKARQHECKRENDVNGIHVGLGLSQVLPGSGNRVAERFGELGGIRVFESPVFWQAACKVIRFLKWRKVEDEETGEERCEPRPFPHFAFQHLCSGNSGVLVAPDLVLTNHHVAGGKKEFWAPRHNDPGYLQRHPEDKFNPENCTDSRFDQLFCMFGAYIRFENPRDPSSPPLANAFDLPNGLIRVPVVEVIESSNKSRRNGYADWSLLKLAYPVPHIKPLRLRCRVPAKMAQFGYPKSGLERLLFGEKVEVIAQCTPPGLFPDSGPCMYIDFGRQQSAGGSSGSPILDPAGFVVAIHNSKQGTTGYGVSTRIEAVLAQSQKLREVAEDNAVRVRPGGLGGWVSAGEGHRFRSSVSMISESGDLVVAWAGRHARLNTLLRPDGRIADQPCFRAVNLTHLAAPRGTATNLLRMASWSRGETSYVAAMNNERRFLWLAQWTHPTEPRFTELGRALGFDFGSSQFHAVTGWVSRGGILHVSFVHEDQQARTGLRLYDSWWRRGHGWVRRDLSAEQGAQPAGPLKAVGNTIVYLDRRERLGLVSISESGGWGAPVSLGVPTPREFVVVTPTSRGREHVISIDGNGQIWHSQRGGPHERWRSQNLHLEGPRLPLMSTAKGVAAWRISDVTPVVFVCVAGLRIWAAAFLGGALWSAQRLDKNRDVRDLSAGFDGSTVFTARIKNVLRLLDISRANWEFSLSAFIGTPELDYYEP